ncbi:MAG: ATP-dependent metallopeptidase FtsH/Yme1/Tma family protein, partial [Actinomycetota bacterium]|nr:ATP-dependent metallopeptidase FtsH/Yme1/Tma family protein [Actinomycetota bacterium]
MDESRKKKLWLYLVYGLLALGIILSIQFAKPFQPTEISYSEFLGHLNAGEVSKVVITDTHIEGTLKTQEGESNFVATRIPDTDIKDLVALLEEKGVDFSGRVENTFWRDFLLTWVLPLGLIAFIWF